MAYNHPSLQQAQGLDKDTLAIYHALEAKVTEQEKKLQEIKMIRQSYLTEMSEMQKKIQEAKETILTAMKQYDPADEFGIGAEQYAGMLGEMESFFDDIAADAPAHPDRKFDWDESRENDSAEGKKDFMELLHNPEYELIYEKHGWAFVKDFIDECCDLEDGGDYTLIVRLVEDKESASMAFANTLLNVLLARNPDKHKTLSCNVDLSADNSNHFWLLRHKA